MHRTRTAARHARRAALAVGLAGLLLVPGAIPASSENALEVSVTPTTAGDTAVRFQQTVDVSGTVPSGDLTAARLVGLRADGSVLGAQAVDSYTLNAEAPTPLTPVTGGGGDYLRVDDGELSGRLTLFCLFAEPTPDCADRGGQEGEVRSLRLEVTVGGVTGLSAPLRVDYTRPTVRDASLVGTREVLVRLTEPVRYPATQPEAPGDWRVTLDGAELPVAAVSGSRPDDCVGHYEPGEDETAGRTGCSRTLTLLQEVDEDAAPQVEYILFDYRVPDRIAYQDFASNRAFSVGVGPKVALDAIRPPTPRIEAVAGAVPADGRVVGNDAQPVLAVSNLKAGHDVLARVTSGGTTTETEPVRADGERLDLQLPDLGDDGEKRIEVVVVDPNGNRSTDAGTPAREDGGPSVVGYGLDTVAPFLLGALAEQDRTLTVTISEPVSGSDAPAAWTVQGADGPKAVTAVSGSGSSRTLTVEGGATPGDRLSYAPTDGRYADEAGNVLADADAVVTGLAAPVVLVPGAEVFTRETTQTVSGTARAGSTVLVTRDVDRDGRADEQLAAVPAGADGAWSADVPLLADARNDLLVQAADGDARSPLATVPAVVQDATRPALQVLSPTAGAVLAGGRDTEVRWSTSDRNAGPSPTVTVELATDGSTFEPVGPSPAADGGTTVRLPQVDTTAARIRLTTTDLAGNTAQALSDAFTIDATTPVFTAATVATRRVRLEFTEPVSGPLGPDWQVAGGPATVESVDGRTGQVRADGARVLVLATTVDFDPDARPQVRYAPAAPALTGELVDAAGQPLDPSMRTVEAADRIRPAAPTVTAVAGRSASGGEVLANAPAPVVSLSGVRAGNRLVVERAQDGEAVPGETVEATGTTAEVTAATVPVDGPHLLRAVAVDPAGNRSTDEALAAPSEDGDADVVYVLDTVAPALTAAVPAGDAIRVDVSEAVAGPNDPADWAFTAVGGQTRQVTSVEGSGGSRTVGVDGGFAAGGTLAYRPAGERYTDPAGNAVADRTLVVGGVPVPVVVTPSTSLVTRERTVTVSGTGTPGAVVELLREGGDDVVGSGTVGRDGSWQASAPLARDSENRFVARASDTRTGDRSAAVPVPAIVQDATAPALELLAPTGGELFRGGQDAEVRWSTSDAHPAPAGIRVELTLDGRRWTVLDGGAAPGDDEGSIDFPVPAVSTDTAAVRVTATDLAGNRSVVTSEAFRIDALAPRFAAQTVSTSEVLVRFTEPVDATAANFTVAGGPAVVASQDVRSASAVRASDVQELLLRTAVPFGPNDTPLVRWAPTPASSATDDAGNELGNDVARALDRIAPAAPSVTTPDDTVYEAGTTRTYSGRSETGTAVQLLAESGSGASSQVRTGAHGTWTAVGQLRRDAAVRLRAVAVDDAGNRSALTTAPTVVQDSQAPQVAVGGVQRGQRYERDTDVRIRWTATDANLVADSVVVDVTTDGGRSWQRLADDQPAEGSLTWRTPERATSAAAVRVRALDRAGRTGAGSEGFFGIGAAATGTTPPAGGSGGSGPGGSVGSGGGTADDVDVVLSVPDRVRGSLPRTGTDLLRVGLFALVALLTGLGFLVAARDARRSRRRRSA